MPPRLDAARPRLAGDGSSQQERDHAAHRRKERNGGWQVAEDRFFSRAGTQAWLRWPPRDDPDQKPEGKQHNEVDPRRDAAYLIRELEAEDLPDLHPRPQRRPM